MINLEQFKEWDFTTMFTFIFCISFFVALIAAILIYHFVSKSKTGKSVFSTRDLTYGAVCIAIAYTLSFFGFKMPNGGTITFAATLPIMIYCYFFGFKKAALVCVTYTLLQLIQDPKIYHPLGAVLDYIIPYLSLIFFGVFARRKKSAVSVKASNTDAALASEPAATLNIETNENAAAATDSETAETSKKKFVKVRKFFVTFGKKTVTAIKAFAAFINEYKGFFIAALCYTLVRFMSHTISGVLLWNTLWGASFIYNLNFLADAAIAVVAGAFLLSSKAFTRQMAVSANTLKYAGAGHENNQ